MIRTQNIFMHVNISSIALLTFKKNEHLKKPNYLSLDEHLVRTLRPFVVTKENNSF